MCKERLAHVRLIIQQQLLKKLTEDAKMLQSVCLCTDYPRQKGA